MVTPWEGQVRSLVGVGGNDERQENPGSPGWIRPGRQVQGKKVQGLGSARGEGDPLDQEPGGNIEQEEFLGRCGSVACTEGDGKGSSPGLGGKGRRMNWRGWRRHIHLRRSAWQGGGGAAKVITLRGGMRRFGAGMGFAGMMIVAMDVDAAGQFQGRVRRQDGPEEQQEQGSELAHLVHGGAR